MTQVPRPQDPPPTVLVHPAGNEGADQTAPAGYFTDVAGTKAAEPAATAGT